jgi:hypothetical protein
MQKYTRTLIEEETNLSNMIEAALKQNAKEDQEASENNELDIVDNEEINLDEVEESLKDNDFSDFNEFLEDDINEDDLFGEIN